MRQIGRALAILLAALLVCGASYGLAGGNRPPSGRPPGFAQAPAGASESAAGAPRRPENPRGRGDGQRGGLLGGAFEMLRSLLIVAVVAALALPLVRLLQRRRDTAQPPGDDPPSP